jgi:hypothetical protein
MANIKIMFIDDDCCGASGHKRKDGGRGVCKYTPALSALTNEIVPDDGQSI